jgi:hypothetical protein
MEKKFKRKKQLISETLWILVVGALFFAAVILLLIVSIVKESMGGLLAAIFFAVLSVFLLVQIRYSISVVCQLGKIQCNTTYDVSLYRPKITYLTRSVRRTKYTSDIFCYGVVFHGANKRKYYYLFDVEIRNMTKDEAKRIEEKIWKELNIQCYENTSIVKTIENDPYFMRIRY